MTPKSAFRPYLPRSRAAKRGAGLLGLGIIALACSAILVNRRAAQAERENLAKGRFVSVDGVQLHFVERGKGRPVVFLHGNGAMVEDLLISGLVDETASRYRAVVFDRPGFGHSERPRNRDWSARTQAALLVQAFALLGIEQPIVVGHSWGALAALAMAIYHPHAVSGLVLASGYYFPSKRLDVALFSPPALPFIGDVISYTMAPLIGELMAPPLVRKMFAPQPVSARFARDFPLPLALRPSQIKAFAEDASHMVAAAAQLSPRYAGLKCPVHILAGDADRIVDIDNQAKRLHSTISGSCLDVLPGAGHMLHHLDPGRVMRAIDLIVSDTMLRPGVKEAPARQTPA